MQNLPKLDQQFADLVAKSKQAGKLLRYVGEDKRQPVFGQNLSC